MRAFQIVALAVVVAGQTAVGHSQPSASPAAPETTCFSAGLAPDIRIAACTQMIGAPGLDNATLAHAYVVRGVSRQSNGDIDQSILDFSESIRLAPNNAGAYLLRAMSYNLSKSFDMAVADCNSYIKLSSNNPDSYYTRGYALLSLSEFDRAIKDFDEVIRLTPANAEAYYFRGLAWMNRGDRARVFNMGGGKYWRAPPNGDASRILTATKADMAPAAAQARADYAKAIADFDMAVQLKPGIADADEQRAKARKKLSVTG